MDRDLNKNRLIESATPLLTLIAQIRHTIDQQDITKFHAQVIEEVKRFEQKLVRDEYSPNIIIAARYCLCTALDEAVLSRSWGANSVWVQQSLLSIFHYETWGGERFYIILENMAMDPRSNIDFLELAYFLLSLGFEGKFYAEQTPVREEIRNRIFYRIRNTRSKPEKALSRIWKDEKPLAENKSKRSRIKKLTMMAFLFILTMSIYYNMRVHNAAKPIMAQLRDIADVPAVTVFSQVLDRPLIERNAQ